MRAVWAVYLSGVAAVSCAGFFSPFWFLGFVPVGVGLVWAAYDLIGETDGESS